MLREKERCFRAKLRRTSTRSSALHSERLLISMSDGNPLWFLHSALNSFPPPRHANARFSTPSKVLWEFSRDFWRAERGLPEEDDAEFTALPAWPPPRSDRTRARKYKPQIRLRKTLNNGERIPSEKTFFFLARLLLYATLREFKIHALRIIWT